MQELALSAFLSSVALPFTREEFFGVFSLYNGTIWPTQVGLYAIAVVGALLAFQRSERSSRAALVVLAVLWLWMGVVYHGAFLLLINPLAPLFAAAFIAQGLLFAYFASRRKPPVIAPTRSVIGWAGGALILIGLVFYPAASALAGHHYPAQPTFGLPCPTTIFTLGMLLWAADSLPRNVFAIPLFWTIVGSIAAKQLGVPEDFLLIVAFATTAILLAVRPSLKQPASIGRKSHEIVERRLKLYERE